MRSDEFISENLKQWFKEKWVRFGPDGKIRGDCARGSEGEGKPKCLPQSKAQALGKKGRASAAAKKRREDPDPERRGPAKNVATKVKEQGLAEDDLDEACWKGYHKEGMKTMFGKRYPNCVKNKNESLEVYVNRGECPGCGGAMVAEDQINEKQDACYHKVKSRYKVWPSAYASGALVQCRKKGAANWGNKSESTEQELDEKWSKKYKSSINCANPKGFSQKAHCAGRNKNESQENMMDELDRIVELSTGMSASERAELAEEFDFIESNIDMLAERNGVDSEAIWEDLESLTDDELYVFAVTQPIMEDLDEMDRRGFLKSMGAGAALAGASSLGASTAFAQSMPNINTQKLNLANKYYAALVQRAKEDGLPLDTRTKNMLKAKAEEMATRQLQQTQSSYPGAQSSEIKRSNNYNQFESEAWQKANKKDKTDGMSQKAVNAYRRENPGSKLKTAVTTKPSKLKKGSKASKRRKSYCSRSRGQMKMHSISCAKTPDKAICKARRRWNCE